MEAANAEEQRTKEPKARVLAFFSSSEDGLD